MKLSLAQINPVIGDFEGNASTIIRIIEEAKKKGVDIVVFPEMAVTGYPPKDLLDKPQFVAKNLETLERIALSTDKNIAAIVGFVSMNEATIGKGLFNSAAFLHEGRLVYAQHKILLPTYDVFDEARYFEPGSSQSLVEYKGIKIGMTICEDIWSTAEFKGRRLYKIDPVDVLVKQGAELIINISASPYVIGKRKVRRTLLSNISKEKGVPIAYVNMVGGNDELIFDGCSIFANKDGEIVREGTPFKECVLTVDLNEQKVEKEREFLGEVEEVYEALILGLRDYVRKCGFKTAIIGISGGIDSAVVAALAAEALGSNNVIGVSMPTRYTSQRSIEYATALAKNLGITLHVVSIDEIYQSYLDTLANYFKGMPADVTEENIQARIRGNILMAFSNKFGAIVLSTGNKSELAVGYCTLYGDLAGGLAVISDLPKTFVYKLASYINRWKEVIPESIIKREPTAELRENQRDTDTLPPYDVLDAILRLYIEERASPDAIVEAGFAREVVASVINMVDKAEYKRRQAPPGLKVTSKAFGWDRRYPIACKC